jgi:hypothetical protein
LQNLADFGHEIMLIHVAGLDDRQPPWRGELELVDAESGGVRRIVLDESAAAAHAEGYDEFCRKLQYLATRNRGRYVSLTTDLPVEDAIFGPLVASNGIRLR